MERTFNISMTEDERLMNLAALGFARVRLPEGEPATVLNSLIDKITKTPANDGRIAVPDVWKHGSGQGTSTAQAILAPAAPRDYFAKDRKGNIPSGPPEGAELKTVKILQAQEAPGKSGNKYLKVIFTKGVGSCFDPALFPHVIKHTGEEMPLYFVKSGNYWNIVGVRA